MKKYNIAQFGSFDVKNYGDLLFPIVLKEELGKHIEIDNLVLFSPQTKPKPFAEDEMVYSVNELDKLNQMYHFDAFIIGGGDLIRLDIKVLNDYQENYDASILMWKIPIIYAKKHNIKVIFNCPGVPFRFEKEAPIVHTLLEGLDYVTVRDEEAKKNLELTNIENIKVVTDSVFIIDHMYPRKELKQNLESLKEKGFVPNIKKYITFQHNVYNINNEEYKNKIKELFQYITEVENEEIIMVPIGYVHRDRDFMKQLVINDKVHLITKELNPYDMLTVFACSDGFIGTSLHGAVTSSTYNVPILSINNQRFSKVTGFLRQIDKEDVDVSNINQLLDIYKKNFRKPYSKKIRLRKREIQEHFKTMAKRIIKGNAYQDINIERKIYNDFYTILKSCTYLESDFDNFKVFFETEKLSYCEENSKIITWQKKKDLYRGKVSVDKDILSIRIDPIESYYIKLKEIKIRCNGEPIRGFMPNAVKIDDWFYLPTKDPQILVELSRVRNPKEVTIECQMKKISYDEIESVFQKLKGNDKIEFRNKGLNSIYRMVRKKEVSLKDE